MTIAIPFVSNDLSPRDNSVMMVWIVPKRQLLRPRANLAARASGRVGARPNATEKTAHSSSDALMVNVLPYRSAALPHAYDVNTRPTINDAPIRPAQRPALSSSREGTRCMARKPA